MTLTEAKGLSGASPAGIERPAEGRRGPRTAVLVAAIVAVAVLVAVLCLVAVHAGTPDSDGATVVLEGQSMSAGHLTLHGWALSLDSFWTVDALFYTLVVLVTGVRSSLTYVVPAVIAALVIVVGALMAREGRRGGAGVAAAATVIALLGLPSYVFSIFFLRGPLHVGTALWCLLAFAGLRRGRLGWGWVGAAVLFAFGILGDFQMIAIGMAPAFVAGVVAMLRTRDWRKGLPVASAPVAGLLLAGIVRRLASVVGTFSIGKANARASSAQMRTNVKHVVTWGAHMLGVGSGTFGTGGVPAPLELVHIVGLLTVVAAVAVAAVGLIRSAVTGGVARRGVVTGGVARRGVVKGGVARRGATDGWRFDGWRLDDLLVLACLADLALFVVIAISNDRSYARYLTAAVIFGAVLAGRLVGRLAATVELGWLRRVGAVVGVAAIAAFAASLAINVTAARPARAYAQLGPFLEAHQLHHGIGDYWSASATTVATNDIVTVRPVTTDPGGRVVRYQKQSTAAWYAKQPFEFLVFDTAVPWGGIDAATATATFGPPAHTYLVGSYRVLVWSHPILVSAAGFAG